jgi:hypothetical protein
VDDDGYFGTDMVFLCFGSQRRLLWIGFRRFITRHGHTVLWPLVVVAVSFSLYGWHRELILNDKVLVGLVFGAIGCAYLAFRWRRRYAPTMERLCFEFRRHDLAAKLSIPESKLSQYRPR